MTASAETSTASAVLAGGRPSALPAGTNRNGTAAPSGAAAPDRAVRRSDDDVRPVPALARGAQMLGEVAGSGYRRPQALVRRADGQTIQLTPLLYRLLCAIDGKRDHADLAEALSERSGKLVTADDVRFLIEAKLRPLGLLRRPDGSEPRPEKASPLLALRLKFVVSNPSVTNTIAAPFVALFRLPVVLAVMTGFAVTMWWIGFENGLASAAHQALYEPAMLLLVFALTFLSAAFHEVGHAAACRFSGAKPGGMGVGLYLVWPAFYTDVTDAYRLGRAGRLRVDLGGLYFNAIFGVAMVGVWAAVRWDALLLVIVAQLVQMVRQLVPVVRFDGYHALADLTGVPDLFLHIKPTLLGMLPTHRRRTDGNPLKTWVRAVVTLWVLIVVPLLAALLVLVVVLLPRILGTALDSLGLQWNAFEANWAQGDVYGVILALLSILTISLPVFGIAYLLIAVVRRVSRRVWLATAGRPPLRAGAVLAGAIVLGALTWAWWPGDQYRPIEADEHLGLSNAFQPADADGDGPLGPHALSRSLRAEPGAAKGTMSGQGRWMLVLLPQPTSATGDAAKGPVAAADGGTSTAPPPDWVFPFDPPREPREGDNQAVAVNTEDGSRVFDMALALVWVTDGGPVDQRNEAYALASCRRCETVGVAFQVVIVIGHAQVVTPTNAAVAVNYACAECLTQALALQLVKTVADMPDDQALADLAEVWTQLEQLSERFELLPLEQVYADLVAARTAILEILERDGGAAAVQTSVAADDGGTAGLDQTTTTTAETPATTTVTETTTTTTTAATADAPSPAEETTSPTTTTTTGEQTTTDGTTTTGGETSTTTSDGSAGTTGGETTTTSGETTPPTTTTTP